MIFYAQETWIGLLLVSIPAVLGAFLFFTRQQEKPALLLLLLSALLMRLLMISLDPFLHEWDERFHALVAKNMMSWPFKPMLVAQPILPYDVHDWSNNHVWVHKQPWFLWQMAASMKIFGANTFALRLPSAIMGTLFVWLVFDLAKNWTQNLKIAFIAAWFATFSHYALELIAGRISLEHNDVAFMFYVTCSLWALSRYLLDISSSKWAILTGVFVGVAILNKWLTALLVYGGWALYLLQENTFRRDLRKYFDILLALCITGLIAIPWQLYIMSAFPVESSIAYQTNMRHITEDLGHPGSIWFHLHFLPHAYHWITLIMGGLGILVMLRMREADRKWTISSLAMILVIFSFFSLVVKTKMPALVYPVASLVFVFMSAGWPFLAIGSSVKLQLSDTLRKTGILCLLVLTAYLSLKPAEIAGYRDIRNSERNNKIHNTQLYQNLPLPVKDGYVIFHCKSFENISLMYYQEVKAYYWYPGPEIINELKQVGHRIAAFRDGPSPSLPAYILEDPDIIILQGEIH